MVVWNKGRFTLYIVFSSCARGRLESAPSDQCKEEPAGVAPCKVCVWLQTSPTFGGV